MGLADGLDGDHGRKAEASMSPRMLPVLSG